MKRFDVLDQKVVVLNEFVLFCYDLVVYQHRIFLFLRLLYHLFRTSTWTLHPLHFASLLTSHLRTQISSRCVKSVQRWLISWRSLHHIFKRSHWMIFWTISTFIVIVVMNIELNLVVLQFFLSQSLGITEGSQFAE